MARTSKFLDEEVLVAATEGLKKLGKSGLVARKLQAIISAKKHGITRTADFYLITKKTLIQWIKELKHESIEALQVQPGRGRKFLLTQEQEQEIQRWIVENSNITLNHLCQMILEKMNIKISKSTAHRIMQREGFAYITPRPKHYKQDEKLKEEFKKKSSD